MTDYTMAQAKRDFERGFLASAEIRAFGFSSLLGTGGYGVVLTSKLGMDGVGYLVDARTKQPREFKTLDAACRAVEGVGFKVRALNVAS